MPWTAAATAAVRATPGRMATTSWPMTLSLCLIRCTSPRPTWSAGATAPSVASTLPFAIQTASAPPPPVSATPKDYDAFVRADQQDVGD